jgi:hypothetical protein
MFLQAAGVSCRSSSGQATLLLLLLLAVSRSAGQASC